MNHKPVLDEQLRTDSCVTFVLFAVIAGVGLFLIKPT